MDNSVDNSVDNFQKLWITCTNKPYLHLILYICIKYIYYYNGLPHFVWRFARLTRKRLKKL